MKMRIDREQFEIERMVEINEEVRQGFPLSSTVFNVHIQAIL
jgi:hypothetical protein